MARPRRAAAETLSSIYRDQAGSWHAKVVMGRRPDGSLDRKHLRRKDKAELIRAVRELERNRDTGQHDWTQEDPSLTDWVLHWLTAIVPMTTRRKTQATYNSQMRTHLLPALGHLKLSDLRPEHLEGLYTGMIANGTSVHTVRAVHRVTRSSLNEAVRRRRLLHNPAAVARPPRLVQREIEPLTVEESRRILAVASTRPNAARWSLALAVGLRQGEALGLLWKDVDLDQGTITIRRAAQRWTWKHGCPPAGPVPSCGRRRAGDCPHRTDGGLLLVEPKTTASRRTIILPAPVNAELRAHRALQARQRLQIGPAWVGEHDLVFATPNGEVIDPARDNKQWRVLLHDANVRHARVHDARHTAATLLLLNGTDVRTVMAIMGWTEMATAQRYTHAVDELRTRAAQRMGSALWPSSDLTPNSRASAPTQTVPQ